MAFGASVAGDVFQHKLDQCFGQIKNVIVIADDIIIVGKRHNHSNDDQAVTTLLNAARRCNVRLNYGKLQYNARRMKLISLWKPIQQAVASQLKARCLQLQPCQLQPARSKFNHLLV